MRLATLRTWGTAAALLLAGRMVAGEAEARVWTDAEGRRALATLRSREGDAVLLESPSGKTLRVRVSALSREDQDYLAGLGSRPSPGDPAKGGHQGAPAEPDARMKGTAGQGPEAPELTHRVVQREDASFAGVVRTTLRVLVSRQVTPLELKQIAQGLVDGETSKAGADAIMLFFYLPGSDLGGPFTAGKAVWAPGGEWARAREQGMRELAVEVARATEAERPEPAEVRPVEEQRGPAAPTYRVAQREDVSVGKVPRTVFRVTVSKQLTEAEIRGIATELVEGEEAKRKVGAVMVFLYLPDSDPHGTFTAGRAVWAPGGQWVRAGEPGPKTVSVEVGNALGEVPPEAIVDLPVETRRRVFRELARLQLGAEDAWESYRVASRQFGITEEQARRIAAEGVIRNWPTQ